MIRLNQFRTRLGVSTAKLILMDYAKIFCLSEREHLYQMNTFLSQHQACSYINTWYTDKTNWEGARFREWYQSKHKVKILLQLHHDWKVGSVVTKYRCIIGIPQLCLFLQNRRIWSLKECLDLATKLHSWHGNERPTICVSTCSLT